MSLKNRYLALIYKGCLRGDPVRKIHRALFDETIRNKKQYADKVLLAAMIKTANKAKKLRSDDTGALAVMLFDLFKREKINDKAKKIINYQTQKEAEEKKGDVIDVFVKKSREVGNYFYLASSHADCAIDHKPYQGRLYVDDKAPEEVMKYAKSRHLYTLQWVMDEPAWLVTRPNCRHYFVSLSEKDVRGKTLKELSRTYKTHSEEGDRALSTPKRVVIEQYEDRLRLLTALYNERPTEELKKGIEKTRILLKKWKKEL